MVIASRTILGVGCDSGRIAAAAATLKRHGFQLAIATNVPAALAARAALQVDVVVVGRSLGRNAANALICRMRQDGGPPVLYLDEDESADYVSTGPGQHPLVSQQFLHMLRTILAGSRDDQDASAPDSAPNELQRLQSWWLVLLAVALASALVAFGGSTDTLGGIELFVLLASSILCGVGCLRSQLHAIATLQRSGINAESWYPNVALGIVFLVPGVLVETGWFLLAMRKHLRRTLTMP